MSHLTHSWLPFVREQHEMGTSIQRLAKMSIWSSLSKSPRTRLYWHLTRPIVPGLSPSQLLNNCRHHWQSTSCSSSPALSPQWHSETKYLYTRCRQHHPPEPVRSSALSVCQNSINSVDFRLRQRFVEDKPVINQPNACWVWFQCSGNCIHCTYRVHIPFRYLLSQGLP